MDYDAVHAAYAIIIAECEKEYGKKKNRRAAEMLFHQRAGEESVVDYRIKEQLERDRGGK